MSRDGPEIAFPFLALDALGSLHAEHIEAGGEELVVFWDWAKDSAAAYRPVAGGQQLTFEVRDGSEFHD